MQNTHFSHRCTPRLRSSPLLEGRAQPHSRRRPAAQPDGAAPVIDLRLCTTTTSMACSHWRAVPAARFVALSVPGTDAAVPATPRPEGPIGDGAPSPPPSRALGGGLEENNRRVAAVVAQSQLRPKRARRWLVVDVRRRTVRGARARVGGVPVVEATPVMTGGARPLKHTQRQRVREAVRTRHREPAATPGGYEDVLQWRWHGHVVEHEDAAPTAPRTPPPPSTPPRSAAAMRVK